MDIQNQIKKIIKENLDLENKIASTIFNIKNLTKSIEDISLIQASNEEENAIQLFHNRLFLQNCPDDVVLLDNNMNFITASSTFLKFIECKNPCEIVGKPFRYVMLSFLQKEWIDKTLKNCQLVYKTGRTMAYDELVCSLNNPAYYLNTMIKCIKDNFSNKIGIALFFMDITDIYSATKKAEHGARVKSLFLAQMSHEIRTPMNAIKGMSDLLQLTELTEQQRTYGKGISDAADSLLTTINDVLDFSKLEAGKLEIISRDYDFNSFLFDIVNYISGKIQHKDIKFFTDIDPEIPLNISGDDHRLKQILSNLLHNAVKFTNSGYVKLTIKLLKLAGGTVDIQFKVEDTGVGIDKERISELFEPFGYNDDPNFRSSGLGLAICTRLLDLLNSKLYVSSEYGKGSIFSFSINQKVLVDKPIVEIRADKLNVLVICSEVMEQQYINMLKKLNVKYTIVNDVKYIGSYETYTTILIEDKLLNENFIIDSQKNDIVIIKPIGSEVDISQMVVTEPLLITTFAQLLTNKSVFRKKLSESIGSFKTKNVKMLIVDDNDVNLMVCEGILAHYDIAVDKAKNGLAALNSVKKKQYDMVLMDHLMPVMDGIESTKNIRQFNTDMPIIALSANNSEAIRQEFLLVGMTDILNKPLNASELNKALLKYLPANKVIIDDTQIIIEKLELIGVNIDKVLEQYTIKEYFQELRRYPRIILDFVTKLVTFDFEHSDNKEKILKDLLKFKQEMKQLGFRELTLLTSNLIFAIESNNGEFYSEVWNNYFNAALLLVEKLNNIFGL